MQTSSSSLQLEGYYIDEFSFSLKPNSREEMGLSLSMVPGLHIQPTKTIKPEPLKVNVEAVVGQHKEDTLRWLVRLNIRPSEETSPDFPYDFYISLVGFFEVGAEYPSHLIETMVRITAPSILYSAGREFVATATGRGPFPAVLLPTLRFLAPTPEEARQLSQKQLPAAKAESRKKTVTKKRASKKVG